MGVIPGLRAFLNGIIDYAGLFPPASLPLDTAIRNFAAYKDSGESWMLARFVCPASRLNELEPSVSLFDTSAPLRISALGRASKSPDDFIAGLGESLVQIASFQHAHGDRVTVEILEAPLPAGAPATEEMLEEAAGRIEKALPGSLTPFWEPDFAGSRDAAAVAGVVAHHNASRHGARGRPAGIKMRTGGVRAEAFPSPALVARVIAACRDAGVVLKFTAGLHHPVRHYSNAVGTRMHGFVNVFAAGILSYAHGLKVETVHRIIEDEYAEHFSFDAGGLEWNRLRASIDEIRRARRYAVVSFGSCSFDEPREDLRSLGFSLEG